jgi:general stress protein YciG
MDTKTEQIETQESPKKQNRGFAAMDPEKRRSIASKGGKAAHQKGTSHEFTNEEARQAGRKGGLRVSTDRRHMSEIGQRGGANVSQDRAWMTRIGRLGGEVVSANREHMREIGRKGGSKRTSEPSSHPAPSST